VSAANYKTHDKSLQEVQRFLPCVYSQKIHRMFLLRVSFIRLTYLAFSLFSWSICSPISATASLCFLRRLASVPSCWMLASSRSRRSLASSASLFLFSSIWAEVAPPASSRRSPSSSSSRARSDRCFSAYMEHNADLIICTSAKDSGLTL